MYILIKDPENSGLVTPVAVIYNNGLLHGAIIEVVAASKLPEHLQLELAEANRDILLGMAQEYELQAKELKKYRGL